MMDKYTERTIAVRYSESPLTLTLLTLTLTLTLIFGMTFGVYSWPVLKAVIPSTNGVYGLCNRCGLCGRYIPSGLR